MKGWAGLIGWTIADDLPTYMVTHQLQVDGRTAKAHRPKTDVLPLCHATNNIFSCLYWPPSPSNRHHRSNGDCLEGKRETYQVCSVQYCVQQLYTVNCTHMNRPNSSLDWVLSQWAHFTVLRFIFVYVLFCVWLYIACMCSIVTWW